MYSTVKLYIPYQINGLTRIHLEVKPIAGLNFPNIVMEAQILGSKIILSTPLDTLDFQICSEAKFSLFTINNPHEHFFVVTGPLAPFTDMD